MSTAPATAPDPHADRTDQMVSTEPGDAQHVSEQLCTFRVGEQLFGIAVQDVQEVLRHQPMTPVPRADAAVTGLINLRGQIVTALDLRVRLGLPPRPADQLPMNVVVRTRGEVVSLLVDDIGDVIDTGDVPSQPVPANMPAEVQEVVRGVRALPEAILLILDADRAGDVSTATDRPGGTP